MHINKISLHPENYPTEEHYPFNMAVFRRTESISFSGPITFFTGENGSGKSTLLRALSQKCNIHIWEETDRGGFQYNPYQDLLSQYIDVEWSNGKVPGSYFSSQIFQDFARFLDEWARSTPAILDYFGGSSLTAKSHGESLLSFFESRYKIKGLYLLDEPETALSPKSQLRLLKILKEMSLEGHAQFIIVTHSPILLALPAADIFSFDAIPVKPIAYEQTEYYRIYKDFLNNRESFLKKLLGSP